ncbi:unnamed protein product [Peniophora sp. CBMAI 1063]|nr:unnamed protein product [Peniophora sp. CBMAI 1063]
MAPTNDIVTLAASLAATTENLTMSAAIRPTPSFIILAAQTALQAPTITTNPTPLPSQSERKHLSTGAIAGLATVSVAAFLSICALTISLSVMFFNRRRSRRAPSKTYMREQGRLGPEREMRTTFDAPVSVDLRGWKHRMNDDSSSTGTGSTATLVQAAPGKQAPSQRTDAGRGPSSPALFRMERPRSEERKSFQLKWESKGHKNLPLTPLDDDLQLSRFSEIKL